MNESMNERRREPRRADAAHETSSLLPRVDVLEDAGGITLYADLPGVSREALVVKVDGESLLIEGEIAAAAPQGMEATYAELRVPRFKRSFTLSRELDGGRIEASLKDGVLKLRIPKHAEAQPRRIAINVA